VTLTRIYPAPAEQIDVDDRERLLELYRPPRAEWLRVNLIGSVTGAAVGVDGTSESLSNPVDRRILGVIRELADVVLIGAQSLRAEGYQHPRRSRLAIVTMSGELGGHRIAPADPAPIVLCPPTAVATVDAELHGAEVVAIDPRDGSLSPVDVIAALRALGLASIVCEGGPALAAQLLDAGLVDELCLSTAPVVGGPVLPLSGAGATTSRAVSLSQLLVDESNGLYARWTVSAS
jgi:riboflavin biosynthesis pyrimidine reductase